jgi:hypothetical protein
MAGPYQLMGIGSIQQKLRSLTSLTTLVAGINKGHSTLANSSELPMQSFETKEVPIDLALKSLAILLVRDDKDITLAAYDLLPACAPADSLHLIAMEGVLVNCTATKGKPESAQDGENGQNCKGIDTESELSSTMQGKPGLDDEHPYNYEANPHEKDATNDRSSHCVVNDSATSHLPHIDTWRYNLSLW